MTQDEGHGVGLTHSCHALCLPALSRSLRLSSPAERSDRREGVSVASGPTEGKDERRGWRWCNPFRSLLLAYASLVAHYGLHPRLSPLRYESPLRGVRIWI